MIHIDNEVFFTTAEKYALCLPEDTDSIMQQDLGWVILQAREIRDAASIAAAELTAGQQVGELKGFIEVTARIDNADQRFEMIEKDYFEALVR